ncbi:MAG: hypothetical protein QXH67_00760 [Candidatus Bathyarchaeia archaeon]
MEMGVGAGAKISRFESIFLILSNFAIVLILVIDLLHLSGTYQFNLPDLTIINLIVLIIAYISYRIKRKIRMEILKIKRGNKK